METEGEIENDNLAAQLSDIKARFEEKAENVGKYILSLEAEAQSIQTELDRLSTRKQKIGKNTDWLKSYLLQEMTVTGIDKIRRDLFTISLRLNPPSVNVIDTDSIPTHFRRIIPETWQPDKKQILEHFKETGEIIAGVEMVTDKKSLQIK